MECLYKKFAKYYDLCYSDKDYSKETESIKKQLKKNNIKGKKVLDVGCGTGTHDFLLKKQGFEITGIDLNKEMLEIARKKSKSIKFLQGDMKDFKLNEKFDVVLCLFSTMHYNKNQRELNKTMKNLYKHLKKDGILIFDLSFTKERWKEGRTNVEHKANNDIDFVRFSKTRNKGKQGILDLAYIIYKNKGNKRFHFGEEKHELGIFKTKEVKKLAEETGLKTSIYEKFSQKTWKKGSKKRPVFVCVKKKQKL